MSVLAKHLRPLIVSNLREDMNPRFRKALMKLFNAVDADLDESEYNEETQDESVDEAVEELEKLIASFDSSEVDPPTLDTPDTPEEVVESIQDDENSPKYKGGSDEPE